MAEVSEQRSRVMRAVKSRDTKPEKLVRRIVHAMGYRYRLYRSDLPGKPDLVFPSRRKVIFVNGCFWHGHNCKRGARAPKTNTVYWNSKIARNMARDSRNEIQLKKLGWDTLIVWECTLSDHDKLEAHIKGFLQ